MADQQQLMEDFAALPVTPASKSAFLAGLPLPGLVALLGDESRVELVCRCIRKLFSPGTDCGTEQAFLVSDGAWLIPAGLAHGNMNVRKTTIAIIVGLLPIEAHRAWLRSQGLFLQLLNALLDSNMQVSHAASGAVLEALAFEDAAEAIFVDSKKELAELLVDARDSTMQLRAVETIAKAWQISPRCTELCRTTPAKAELVRMLDSDDMLLQLNAVEVIGYLPHGDVGEDILPRILDTAEACFGGGALPTRLLDCVAKYVASGAGTGEAAAILPARLCTMVAERLVAAHQRATIGTDAEAVDLLHVVATLCSSPHGVMALHRSKTLAPVAGTLPQYIQSLNSASRLSGFAALEAVAEAAGAVAQKGIGAEDAEVLGVGADLEGLAQVAAFLFKLSKSSIQEDKVGALCCMRALSQHAWGLKSLFAIADFLPHLTDRKAESSKRALDEKLRVVEAAIAHPDAESVLGANSLELLKHFASTGAYYTPQSGGEQQPVVATLGM